MLLAKAQAMDLVWAKAMTEALVWAAANTLVASTGSIAPRAAKL